MTVVTFYKFVRLSGLGELRRRIAALAESLDLKGTVLLAEEGINATLCGKREQVQALVAALEAQMGCGRLPAKYSTAADGNPVFYRLKVRIKPEIVSFGQPGIGFAQPGEGTGAPVGQRVDAEHWNALLDDAEVTVVDVRNSYEVGIGAFPGAIDPGLGHFRDFPAFARRHLDAELQPRVAMYCTGGIRCEKASAWLLREGFKEVFQLDGGILRYLEAVPPTQNRWRGECFVFDQRVSVDAGLDQGTYRLCFACRAPLSASDLESSRYRQGVHCPRCVDDLARTRRAGLEERQRQVALAEARGVRHIGGAGAPNAPSRSASR